MHDCKTSFRLKFIFFLDGKNGKKRTCPRKCMADSDCLNDRKLCLCDGACGMSCIRPEKECPELPDPPHGQVNSICKFLPISVESAIICWAWAF